jgi:hypothetical protein
LKHAFPTSPPVVSTSSIALRSRNRCRARGSQVKLACRQRRLSMDMCFTREGVDTPRVLPQAYLHSSVSVFRISSNSSAGTGLENK